MTAELAEALAHVDNPEVVEKILSAVDDDLSYSSLDQTDELPTLQDKYEDFLSQRRDRSPATIAQYKRTIPDFIDYAAEQSITTPGELTTNLIDAYDSTLRARYGSDATILTYTKNVRTWLDWLNTRGLCDDTLVAMLSKEELGLSPNARDIAIPAKYAQHILKQLRTRAQGTPVHAVMEFIWNGGPRLGDAHSADCKDFQPDSNTIAFRHRPDEGTRLKNGSERDNKPGDGERNILVSDTVVQALQLYIGTERPDTTDEYGREPLFATERGRASKSTLRRWLYEATSCRWAPESRDGPVCDGDCDPDSNVCPYSYHPHAIRRGAIVHHLSNDLRRDRASERFDVAVPTLKRHYDPRTKDRKKQDRADAVRQVWSN
jgi:site-specific recombinase XerC